MPDAQRFIAENTRLLTPPLVPEIKLHLAEESIPIWKKTEEELGEMNVPPPYWAFCWPGGQALTRYLLDNPKTVKGKRVLDFAAGSGISGIAAARGEDEGGEEGEAVQHGDGPTVVEGRGFVESEGVKGERCVTARRRRDRRRP